MHIRWYGHAAFRIIPETGPTIITDPYTPEGVGYPPITDNADVVLISSDLKFRSSNCVTFKQ